MSNNQRYSVYKLRFNLTMQDPDMPSPRFHTLIFVETNENGPGTGIEHHVTGDITTGMYYESRLYHNPDQSGSLHSKEFIGYTNSVHYPQAFDACLRSVPAPTKQKAFNPRTMRTEPVKSWTPLLFYEPGEARRPLIKCTEWTERMAIPSLLKGGYIVSG